MPAWRGHRGGLVQFPVTREPVLNFFPVAESRCGIPVPMIMLFWKKTGAVFPCSKERLLKPETASLGPQASGFKKNQFPESHLASVP